MNDDPNTVEPIQAGEQAIGAADAIPAADPAASEVTDTAGAAPVDSSVDAVSAVQEKQIEAHGVLSDIEAEWHKLEAVPGDVSAWFKAKFIELRSKI